MSITIFNTPLLSPFLGWISKLILKIIGWKMEGTPPDAPKYVLIAAPHTSNWDLPVTMTLAFAFRVRLFWMGKRELFQFPLGWLYRWLSGIAIDRSKSQNMVAQIVQRFDQSERLVVVVPPEGTRGKENYWKTGFYYIAHGAGVPIVLGFLDWKRKAGGYGPLVMPTGDIEKDMEKIKAFYANVTAKFPEKTAGAEIKTLDPE